MTTNVTISQIYMNTSVANFFFRKQAYRTLEDLIQKSQNVRKTIDLLDQLTEEKDLDMIEELFYNYDAEAIAETYDIELKA